MQNRQGASPVATVPGREANMSRNPLRAGAGARRLSHRLWGDKCPRGRSGKGTGADFSRETPLRIPRAWEGMAGKCSGCRWGSGDLGSWTWMCFVPGSQHPGHVSDLPPIFSFVLLNPTIDKLLQDRCTSQMVHISHLPPRGAGPGEHVV